MSVINIQPVEKQDLLAPTLSLHSIFYTIQGEGPFTGHPAIFVRLAGCNLQCPGCDTDYTSTREAITAGQLLSKILLLSQQTECKFVVLTGGEPFRQNIAPIVRMMVSSGLKVQIETNGTLHQEDLPWDSITIVCSPKAGKVNAKLAPHIDAYKYVLAWDSLDVSDGLPILALDHTASPRVARPHFGYKGLVYLQPMDSQDKLTNEMNMDACVESCMEHGYILQLQIHKLIGVE
jgi:organic radical activating enzyme